MKECECGSRIFAVVSSDSDLDDCDLQETFQCVNCNTRYDAKYKLISWGANTPLHNSERTRTLEEKEK